MLCNEYSSPLSCSSPFNAASWAPCCTTAHLPVFRNDNIMPGQTPPSVSQSERWATASLPDHEAVLCQKMRCPRCSHGAVSHRASVTTRQDGEIFRISRHRINGSKLENKKYIKLPFMCSLSDLLQIQSTIGLDSSLMVEENVSSSQSPNLQKKGSIKS